MPMPIYSKPLRYTHTHTHTDRLSSLQSIVSPVSSTCLNTVPSHGYTGWISLNSRVPMYLCIYMDHTPYKEPTVNLNVPFQKTGNFAQTLVVAIWLSRPRSKMSAMKKHNFLNVVAKPRNAQKKSYPRFSCKIGWWHWDISAICLSHFSVFPYITRF